VQGIKHIQGGIKLKKIFTSLLLIIVCTTLLLTGCNKEKIEDKKSTKEKIAVENKTSTPTPTPTIKESEKETKKPETTPKKEEDNKPLLSYEAREIVNKFVSFLNNNKKDQLLGLVTVYAKNNFVVKGIGFLTLKPIKLKEKPFKSSECGESILDEYKRLGIGSIKNPTEGNIKSIWLDCNISETRPGSIIENGNKCVEFWVLRKNTNSPWLIDDISIIDWNDIMRNNFENWNN